MCGIACIVGKDTDKDVHTMLDVMGHRGPNDRGVWSDNGIHMGHLRLSIIDTSSAGHQPMKSHDGRYVIAFNGEIFNYIELREELQRMGSTFRTIGDTEVIVEAYRQWGAACVQRFNGMWAFTLWDTQEKVLFASRDRFGIKPFYYRLQDQVLHIASEMKALYSVQKSDMNAGYLYAFFDRKTPMGDDRTVFADIHHLLPGHSLLWKNGNTHIERYWKSDPSTCKERYDYSDPVRTFRDLVIDAVRLRLRSDVPVGICLSGGIDSSVIAVVMKSLGVTPNTFSTVYAESGYSEEMYINAVNAAVGAQGKKITPSSSEFFSTLERIIAQHDEPVRMPGVFSHWKVMSLAHNDVTVLLDGQGADEICGGYEQYYASYCASLLQDIVRLRGPMDAVRSMRLCLSAVRATHGSARPTMQEAIMQALPSSLRQIVSRESAKSLLFTDAFRQKAGAQLEDSAEERDILRTHASVLDRAMYRDFAETNLPMLLRYEDRNSMAFSLEARVPFLDYRVVEFCHGLDYRYKIRGGVSKWILREAFADLLPTVITERKDKKGFPTPLAVWFKGPLMEEVTARLDNSPLYDLHIVNQAEVKKLLQDHAAGVANNERALFRLLTLSRWLQVHFS